jgi:predicted RNA-binding protein associated with RNAse of E/G family
VADRWRPGDRILLREVWDGRVWAARPVTVVADEPRLIVLYLAVGTAWKRPVRFDGSPLRMPSEPWRLRDDLWRDKHFLHLVTPGAAHASMPFWSDPDWTFGGWYVNLQEPLRRTPIGFDYMDQMLDLLLSPDLAAHRWKDEDELVEEVERGLLTAGEAEGVRAEAERVLQRAQARRSPFDGRWDGWRPDPAWPVPGFPPHWDRVA